VHITLACLDLSALIGGDQSAAYLEALATMGLVPGTDSCARALARLHDSFGLPQRELFRSLVPSLGETWAATTEMAFERAYGSFIGRHGLFPAPGAEAALDKLSSSGVRTCLLTGFSNRLLSRILDTLGWWDRADLAISPDDVAGRGCPCPDMILASALRLSVDDVREVAVVGASRPVLESGHRSGAGVVAGIGVDTPETTHTLNSPAALPDLLLAAAPVLPQRL
jgi:phosphoglycolate phosphatase-like HAD superfamily hydrolase